MAGTVHQRLLLKYRPQSLTDTGISQASVTLLTAMLRSDRLRVMLVGDSGSGKTALIQLLKKLYYGPTPTDDLALHVTPHGSKTVNDQRADLRTFCRGHGTRKRMVIMDDAEHIAPALHQTLKACVDKHGDNILVVCACTCEQRVCGNLRARLLTIRTRHLGTTSLRLLLERVCDAEKLRVGDAAKKHILDASGPSARALLQNVEKLALHGGRVTLDLAHRCCSSVHPQVLAEFTEACRSNDGGYDGARRLYDLYDRGHSIMDLLDAYLSYVKVAPLPDHELYPAIQCVAESIRQFYDDHDDVISLALFARRLNSVLRRCSGNEQVLAEGTVSSDDLVDGLADEPAICRAPAEFVGRNKQTKS